MKFPYIEKYLPHWLEEELKFIEAKEWVHPKEQREKVSNNPAYFLLNKIDNLLNKFENLEGFELWIKEAKNSSKNFKHLLFELMVLENLSTKVDKLILKPKNPKSSKEPDALIITKGNSYYIEMSFLDSIPQNITTKVKDLFNKSTEKFRGSKGLHFIGTYGFFEWINDKRVPKSEFNSLNNQIKIRFNRFGSSIVAFILTDIIIKTTADYSKNALDKLFWINCKPPENGGPKDEFFEEIFDVNEFKVY